MVSIVVRGVYSSEAGTDRRSLWAQSPPPGCMEVSWAQERKSQFATICEHSSLHQHSLAGRRGEAERDGGPRGRVSLELALLHMGETGRHPQTQAAVPDKDQVLSTLACGPAHCLASPLDKDGPEAARQDVGVQGEARAGPEMTPSANQGLSASAKPVCSRLPPPFQRGC